MLKLRITNPQDPMPENEVCGVFPLQQSAAYAKVMEQIDNKLHLLEWEEQGERLGFLRLYERTAYRPFHLTHAMRGPVWLTAQPPAIAEVAEQLRQHIPKDWRRWCFWIPEAGEAIADIKQAGWRQVVSAHHLAVLPLHQDEATQQSLLHPKWQTSLTQAQQTKLKIEIGGLDHPRIHWLFENDKRQRKKNGYESLPRWFIEGLYAHGMAIVTLFAMEGAQPVAAILCCLHGRTATYQIGYNSLRGRELKAHHLLLWRAMRHAVTQNISWLDLGMVDTERGAGIARFKLGCGAQVRPQSGTFV